MSDTLTRNFESAALSPLNHPNDAVDLSPASDPLAPQPSEAGETLTRGMEVALLFMRTSDYRISRRIEWAQGVLKHLRCFGRAEVGGADFHACAKRGWATLYKGCFHVLTPEGRRQADEVAKRIALDEGLHIGGFVTLFAIAGILSGKRADAQERESIKHHRRNLLTMLGLTETKTGDVSHESTCSGARPLER
jgi:hypothetical protein